LKLRPVTLEDMVIGDLGQSVNRHCKPARLNMLIKLLRAMGTKIKTKKDG